MSMQARRLRSGEWAVFCTLCGTIVQDGFRTRHEAEAYAGGGCQD